MYMQKQLSDNYILTDLMGVHVSTCTYGNNMAVLIEHSERYWTMVFS